MLLLVPLLHSRALESWLWDKQSHILDANAEHTQLSWEPCSSPARYCHLSKAVTESLKGYSIVLSSQPFQDGGEHGKNRELHERGLTASLLLCEVNSLIRSNAVCNTLMMEKAFCKSTEGSSGRSSACREVKSRSRVSVHHSKHKILPLPWWEWSV